MHQEGIPGFWIPREIANRLDKLEGHIRKTIALLAVMRYVDKHHADTDFDVFEWERELRETYPELIGDE